MARSMFGGRGGDYVIADPAGNSSVVKVTPNLTGTGRFYWAKVGGTEHTDLRDEPGNPISGLSSNASGAIVPFQGPDDGGNPNNRINRGWADFGGPRILLEASDGSAGTSPGQLDTVTAGNLANLTSQTRLGIDGLLAAERASIETAASSTYGRVSEAPLNILRYGAIGDFNTNNNAALQASLDAVPAAGGEVFIPKGIFVYNAPLSVKPRTTIIGEGDASRLWSTHVGSSLTFIHATSSYVADYFTGRMFTLVNNNALNLGAGIEIVSGQQHNLDRVAVVGHKFGTILDGSQISTFTGCIFDQQLAAGAAAWLTSGPDRTAGSIVNSTNKISFTNCDLNCQANGNLGVVDDGGWAHEYVANNYNYGGTQIRLAGTAAARVDGGEFENATIRNILLAATRWLGAASSRSTALTVKSATISAGAAPLPNGIEVEVNAVYALSILGNSFFTTAAAVKGAANIDTLISLGNFQNGSGALYDGTAVGHVQMDKGTAKSMLPVGAGSGFARPSAAGMPAGIQYWDGNLGKPVWTDGTGAWRDATNAIMA